MTNNVQNQAHKITITWIMLKLTYGIVPMVAGTDKFFNVLVNWQLYLNPKIVTLIPLSPAFLMALVGVIEVVAGLTVLFFSTRFGAYLVAIWLTCIAASLVAMGHFYDVAVRDIVMAIGALALAQLTGIRKHLK